MGRIVQSLIAASPIPSHRGSARRRRYPPRTREGHVQRLGRGELAVGAFREAIRETVKRYALWYLIEGVLLVVARILAILLTLSRDVFDPS